MKTWWGYKWMVHEIIAEDKQKLLSLIYWIISLIKPLSKVQML